MDDKTTPATDGSSKEVARSGWEKLLGMTPVLMTVVATVLAGLSNSEMIKAQYYRSLAAQNQSKVGDQWAFFQAKRSRGVSHEMTIKLLNSLAARGDLSPEHLRAQVDRLERTLRQGDATATATVSKVQTAKAALGAQYTPVQVAAEHRSRSQANLPGQSIARRR